MKLGYFTDTHARADSPCGRTDEFRFALYSKLEACGQIWRDERVDHVLFGGDLFHTPDPPNSVKFDIMHILKGWGKSITGVVGSHDYYGRQMKSLKRTALGIFYKADIIELVGGDGLPEDVLLYIDRQTVVITGTPHTYWLSDNAENFFAQIPERARDAIHIQLVHGDLLDRAVPWPHVLVSQVKTQATLVLSGHYHPGWREPIVIGDTTFINPGSIARLENTGRQRTPRVCIIEIQGGKISSLKFIELQTALPHPFEEKIVDSDENTMQDITSLLQLIDSTNVEAVDIKKQLPLVASQMNFDNPVLDRAFQFIEAAGSA